MEAPEIKTDGPFEGMTPAQRVHAKLGAIKDGVADVLNDAIQQNMFDPGQMHVAGMTVIAVLGSIHQALHEEYPEELSGAHEREGSRQTPLPQFDPSALDLGALKDL